jgi:anti-sigma regulatory factor (Ser/Thr protein kinase)
MGSPNTLTVPGRYDQIQPICNFVAQAAEEAGFDDDTVFHVQLACDEACTNVIEHSYGAENVGSITVSCQVQRNEFTIVIRDNGRPFDPDDIPQPQVPTSNSEIDQLKVGGLGIHFMRKLMDEVRFMFDQHGNTLIMIKHLPGGKKQ